MSILLRMVGAARLDGDTYEEVENDTSVMPQALLVVIVVSILTGLGQYFSGDGDIMDALVFGVFRGLLFWAIWALMIYMIGSTILRTAQTHANWGQVSRGTAFAQAPGVLNVFSFIPTVGPFILLIVGVWQIVGVVISVRHTLDYTSTLRAFFVALLAWIPSVIMFVLVAFVIWGISTGFGNGNGS